MKRIYPLILTILALGACSNDSPQVSDTTKADFDQKQAEIEKSIAEQAEQDRPQFDVPAVDYTTPVAKVNLQDHEEIIAAVGSAVVEKETGANQNGEPMTTYYFSEDLRNGLELSLSREFVDVIWKYDQENPEKAAAVFEDGQRISRALLGGKDGAALYENISKGRQIDLLTLDDGTVVKSARCGSSMCRYVVER
ncbi:hypothetical protein [Acinetobacter schindleri]|uniref:hypothetical protein n=1 Tax=Acinetobacter schindleri TaxID=108981 RepID=UPI002361BEBC|nr:hypothetical protein [Acinetobacter schindleri]